MSILYTRMYFSLLKRVLLLLTLAVSVHCGIDVTPNTGGLPDEMAFQLALSPSNPQIGAGTEQRFALHRLLNNGRAQDVTTRTRWRLITLDGQWLSDPSDGVVSLPALGRYIVVGELDGQMVATHITATTAAIRSVTVGPSSPKVAKGTTQQFKATAIMTDGTTQDVTDVAAWSVKDTMGSDVAQISSRGLANAKNVGTSRVSARYKLSTGATNLVVTPAALKSLRLGPLDPTLAKGSSQAFTVTGQFSDGTSQDVTALASWSLRDVMGSGVASIDSQGKVLAESPGQAEVSAEYLGQIVSTKLTVTPAAVTSLSVSPASALIPKGATQAFLASASFSDGSRQDVSSSCAWSAEDVSGTGVASLTMRGVATGNAVGVANIRCTYRGRSSTAQLRVTAAVLTSLTITPPNATLAKGLSQTFVATGQYSDGTTQDVSGSAVWTSVDVMGRDVASASLGGVVKATNLGEARIQAQHMGRSASATLKVTPVVLTQFVIAPETASIATLDTQQFVVKRIYSDGTEQDVSSLATWSVTDVAPGVGVATITPAALATGKSKGTALVTASQGGLSAQATLIVGTLRPGCSAAGWCWSNPLPHGNPLYAVWALDANNVWAVGSVGSIMKWNGTTWTAQLSGTTDDLKGIWGSDANHIWAVGDKGRIVAWNGSAWAPQTSRTTMDLAGVGGSDARNVWTVGDEGTILKWDGTAWAPQASGTSSGLNGLIALSSSSAWAVGYDGTILKWNGSTWAAQASGTTEMLKSIWGSDANHVWAVGGWGGLILKWDGTAWSEQPSGVTTTFESVWGTDSSHVWAVGSSRSPEISFFDGTSWTRQAGGSESSLTGIAGSDANHIWAVGLGGGVTAWNGSAWATQKSASKVALRGVWGTDSRNIWAVGESGTLRRSNGSTWATVASGTPNHLHAVWGTDASSAWAVGAGGVILKWNGSSWSTQSSGTARALYGVWGSSANNLWTVGDSGTILRWNGSAWSPHSSGTTAKLRAVFGTDASHVWAAGDAGTLLFWNGSAWSPQASGTTQSLTSIWGSDASNVWVTVSFGALLKWNGATWSTQSIDGIMWPTGIFGTAANNVWVVGGGGAILRWNGTRWIRSPSGTSNGLQAIWGSDADHLWAVGSMETILQYAP
jgi:hypothetical protein